jgi:hypothetical protein
MELAATTWRGGRSSGGRVAPAGRAGLPFDDVDETAQIETKVGTRPRASLIEEVVPFETDELFAFDRKYRLPGSDEVVAHYRDIKFQKVNPFAETPAEVMTSRGLLPTADLDKTTGVLDNDNEFSCWVEYRARGESEIIHRSADVKLKKASVVAQSEAGGF